MTVDDGDAGRVNMAACPLIDVAGVEDDEARGVKPFSACFEREGTTVRVECVSRLSREELEDSEGDGDAVLEENVLSDSIGGGLGILRAASISPFRKSSMLDKRCCRGFVTKREYGSHNASKTHLSRFVANLPLVHQKFLRIVQIMKLRKDVQAE